VRLLLRWWRHRHVTKAVCVQCGRYGKLGLIDLNANECYCTRCARGELTDLFGWDAGEETLRLVG
jgi:hypothetical protein